jgi:tetratricopeptide (TPR) repeat protein
MKSLLYSIRYYLVVVLVFSTACCFIPLFNYLGYEFSALAAVVLSFVCGLGAISSFRSNGSSPALNWKEITRNSSLLVAVPFLTLSLNAFIVKNCSFVEGMEFYALSVLPAVFFSLALSNVASLLIERRKKTVFLFVSGVVLFHILFVTMTGPQIFAFNPIVGFFPGLTYDESLNVLPRLATYRIGTVALSIVLLSFARFVAAKKQKLKSSSVSITIGGLAFTCWVSMFVASDRLGHSSSESFIRMELWGSKETEHFEIAYPLGKITEARLGRIVNLAEFQFDKLRRALRVQPVRKIKVFLYNSDEQKGLLVGAAGTNISKPWLWQIHINTDDVDAVLKHELVHVMAAEFGFPLLRVAPNSGLIEGLAMAIERVSAGKGIHKTAAEIYDIGVNADVASLFSFSGFFKVHPGVSYTLAGSFCRYLIDTYGFRRFKVLYRNGDFEAQYGRSREELIYEWQRFLESFRSTEAEKLRANYLFRRPSIFGKECARVIANLNQRTRDMLATKNYPDALSSAERSLSLSRSGDAIQQKMVALFKLGRFEQAAAFAATQLADSASALSLLPMKLQWGDALWGQDSVSGSSDQATRALQLYEQVENFHLSLAWDEASLVRLTIGNHPRQLGALKELYFKDFNDSTRTRFLETLFVKNVALPYSAYLYSKELYATEHWQGVIDVMKPLRTLDVTLLEYLRLQRIARSYYWLSEYEKAKMFFWQSQNFTDDEVRLLETREWIERCEFSKGTVH